MGHLKNADFPVGIILSVPAFLIIIGIGAYFLIKSSTRIQYSLIELLSLPFCMIPSFYFCSGNWSSFIGLALVVYQFAGISLGLFWVRSVTHPGIRALSLLLGAAVGVVLYFLAFYALIMIVLWY